MKRAPTIIEAMTSSALFGKFYDGPTWKPWQCVLKAAYHYSCPFRLR
jgi:hypothetical protein